MNLYQIKYSMTCRIKQQKFQVQHQRNNVHAENLLNVANIYDLSTPQQAGISTHTILDHHFPMLKKSLLLAMKVRKTLV